MGNVIVLDLLQTLGSQKLQDHHRESRTHNTRQSLAATIWSIPETYTTIKLERVKLHVEPQAHRHDRSQIVCILDGIG